jgi:dynein heavy chain 2
VVTAVCELVAGCRDPQLVSQLPEGPDAPRLFGLPDNIRRVTAQRASEGVLTSLKAMSVAAVAARGFDRGSWAAALGPLIRLWDSLVARAPELKQAAKEVRGAGRASRTGDPESGGGGGRSKKVAVGGGAAASPVDSFVVLERAAAVALVEAVNRTLAALARVLRGQEALGAEVAAAGAALLSDAVPSAWDSLWEGPAAPADYLRAVVAKAAAIEHWWTNSQAGQLLTSGARAAGRMMLCTRHGFFFLTTCIIIIIVTTLHASSTGQPVGYKSEHHSHSTTARTSNKYAR